MLNEQSMITLEYIIRVIEDYLINLTGPCHLLKSFAVLVVTKLKN